MSILRKCKKVLSGCIHKNGKEYENGPILNGEFVFKTNAENKLNELTENFHSEQAEYLEYDNLQHISAKLILKDTSNTRGLKRIMPGLHKKKKDENNNILYNELYSEHLKQKTCTNHDEVYYSQITGDLLALSDSEPLIDSKEPNYNDTNRLETQKSLTTIRELDSFSSQLEAFEWYLKLLFDTMAKSINEDKSLVDSDKAKRLNIANAHVLYSHNFYQMRTSNNAINQQVKQQLAKIHPCLIVLACLLDSDAVRIIDSHKCECDNYVYLFSTRLKFCAWKSRFYIILKRPNRSSIDRLTLIQDLTSCHKLLQDKSVRV